MMMTTMTMTMTMMMMTLDNDRGELKGRPVPWLRATLRGRGGSFNTGEGSLRATGEVGPVNGTLFARGFTTEAYRDRNDFSATEARYFFLSWEMGICLPRK